MLNESATETRPQSSLAVGPRRRGVIAELVAAVEVAGGGPTPDAKTTARCIEAVDRLVDLRAEEAVHSLLWMILLTSDQQVLHEHIILRLPELGPRVLEPALAMARTDVSPDRGICRVLARLGIRDRRCLSAFGRVLEERPAVGAKLFAEYGDRRARGVLRAAMRKMLARSEKRRPREAMAELLRAYAGLGGMLSREMQARVTTWLEGAGD
jgi:hypothetical protein